MKVVVLGCGPAGLLSAYAVEEAGHEVTILSKKEPSWIGGAQYLHRPVESLTGIAGHRLRYLKLGDRDGYAEKVYGDRSAPCSWAEFGERDEIYGYPLQPVYQRLYNMYESKISNVVVGPLSIERLVDDFDLVISSIPRPALCRLGVGGVHTFRSRSIAIKDQFAGLDINNLIVYSGRPEDSWYRMSNLWGHQSVEFAAPATGLANGVKPLGHDCDCHRDFDERLLFVGRFGRWEKGVLISDAYGEVRERIGETADAV